MYIALLSALANAGNVLLDKLILANRKVRLELYIPVVFVFLFLISFLTLPWLGAINTVLAANRTYIFYVILMVLLAIMWNIFYYQGLKRERLVEFEMIIHLTPLVTILLAAFFYPEEFKLPVFIAAL